MEAQNLTGVPPLAAGEPARGGAPGAVAPPRRVVLWNPIGFRGIKKLSNLLLPRKSGTDKKPKTTINLELTMIINYYPRLLVPEARNLTTYFFPAHSARARLGSQSGSGRPPGTSWVPENARSSPAASITSSFRSRASKSLARVMLLPFLVPQRKTVDYKDFVGAGFRGVA